MFSTTILSLFRKQQRHRLFLCRAPIDEGKERSTVVESGLSSADGLAVDWIYGHIYWTNADKDSIELANFEGNMQKTLFKSELKEPRSIAVDPLNG